MIVQVLLSKRSNTKSVWSGSSSFIVIYLLLSLNLSQCSIVLSNTGGYSEISVAISSELNGKTCGAIVNSIKNAFAEASKALQLSTSATFQGITVIIPESWNNCEPFQINNTDGLVTYNGADYRVGLKHPIFGEDIWTKQPRGCGMAGEYVYLPYSWLFRTDIQKGNHMLQEWAKFRWGIFEEYGHYLDKIYPESFSDETGKGKTPNYCTNEPLVGSFQSDCQSKMDCKFNIDNSGNDYIRSSVMAVPDVAKVYDFCDESTHQSRIPSKQNVICNGKSNKEVIGQHSDAAILKNINSQTGISSNPLSISVVRENRSPSIAIVFETTDAMKKEPNQFDFEKESISQFIVYEAPSTATIGVISFSDFPTVISGMTKLDATSRRILSNNVLETTTNSGKANLKIAIEATSKTLGAGNGAILLLTKCTNENPVYSAQELAAAANGHSVWVILYPYVSGLYLKTFSELVSLTGGQLHIIEKELTVDVAGNSLMSPNVRMKLSQSFRQILHLEPSVDIKQVSYKVCSNKTCRIDLEINSNIESSSTLYLYYSMTDIVSTVTIIEGGSCVMEDFGHTDKLIHATSILKCNLQRNAQLLSLRVERQLIYGDLIAELVGHPKFNNTIYDFKIYSSSSVYDLQYTTETAPVILMEVTYLGRLILFANVSIEIPYGTSSVSVNLKDDGTGADITGNDGIYSGYLVPIVPVGGFLFNVTAHDNSYGARLSPAAFVEGNKVICCGSSIPLPINLDPAPAFNLSRKSVSARVTSSPSDVDLPPGQIKDFTQTGVNVGTTTATMTFTAPGADLDYGTASEYILTRYLGTSAPNDVTLSVVPSMSGSQETLEVTVDECDLRYLYTITALDYRRQRGPPSNMVALYIPCKVAKGNASAGAIVGIVFACLILAALVVALIYWLMRRKSSKSKGRGITPKIKGHKSYTEAPTQPTDTPTVLNTPPPSQVQQIRNIHDLGIQPAIATLPKEEDNSDMSYNFKVDNSSIRYLPDSENSNSNYDSHHFEIIVAGDHYLPDSANIRYADHNEPVNDYRKRTYSKEFLTKLKNFENHGSHSSLHSSSSHSQNNINQVGIPISTNPNANRVNRSLENLLRTGPPVPPKRVRYYEV